jgi:hypothetical protein
MTGSLKKSKVQQASFSLKRSINPEVAVAVIKIVEGKRSFAKHM